MGSHSHPILILDCESKSTFGFDVFVKPQRSNPREKSIAAAATLLRIRYRDFDHHNRKDPFEELLFILCSVQTQESSYRKTFRQLRRAFPRLSDLAAAPLREIEKPLVPGGLYRSKGRSIRAICRRIVRLYGRLSLAPLRKLSDQDAEEMLTSLPGVGLKVARCVMLYSLARKVFPVDTHCWRVCRRLGWVRSTKEGAAARSCAPTHRASR